MNDNHKGVGSLWSKLKEHWQHNVEIIQYVDSDNQPIEFALVCNDCQSIILSAQDYDLEFIGEDLKEYKNV